MKLKKAAIPLLLAAFAAATILNREAEHDYAITRINPDGTKIILGTSDEAPYGKGPVEAHNHGSMYYIDQETGQEETFCMGCNSYERIPEIS